MTSLCVALTGGIGVGKSTVAEFLSEKGACVVNVDTIGHSILQPGKEEYQEIVGIFGKQILSSKGEIDRSILGEIVFGSQKKLRELESITHPSINNELLRTIQSEPAPVVILDMAVLVEKPLACISGTPLYQKVLVVESVTEARVQRLLKRGLSEEEIISRMESQASDEERREVADLIIEKNGSLNDLKLNTVTIWEEITLWLETEL